MSIWSSLNDPEVAFTDGTLFGAFGSLEKDYCWWDSGSGDSLKEMNRLGWGLIAPAILSKWMEDEDVQDS